MRRLRASAETAKVRVTAISAFQRSDPSHPVGVRSRKYRVPLDIGATWGQLPKLGAAYRRAAGAQRRRAQGARPRRPSCAQRHASARSATPPMPHERDSSANPVSAPRCDLRAALRALRRDQVKDWLTCHPDRLQAFKTRRSRGFEAGRDSGVRTPHRERRARAGASAAVRGALATSRVGHADKKASGRGMLMPKNPSFAMCTV